MMKNTEVYVYFHKPNMNYFFNKYYEIPQIKNFNNLKNILNNSAWINYNIIEQSDTFLPY